MDLSVAKSICIDSQSGSFYTYSIALIASILGPLFVGLLEDSPTRFKTIKVDSNY